MAVRSDPRNRAFALGAIILGFLAFVALLILTELNWYVAWLAGWSLSLFLLYGIDKTQAVRQGWRVPEIVLHALALIGGFIGGWLGMLIFRHKTRKPVFQIVLAVATVIGIALLYYFVLRQ